MLICDEPIDHLIVLDKKTIMKFLLLSFVVLLTLNVISQTNVISTRSHSGDLAMTLSEDDNFGLPPMETYYDTVILLNDNCLIEVKTMSYFDRANPEYRLRDTICDHPYLKGSGKELNEIKQKYPKGTTFIGFKRKQSNISNEQSYFFHGSGAVASIVLVLSSTLSLLRRKD